MATTFDRKKAETVLPQLEKGVSLVNKNVRQVNESVRTATAKATEATEKAEEAKATVETVKTDVEQAKGDITSVKADIVRIGTEVDIVESSIASLGSRVTTAEGKVESVESDITTLEGRVQTAEGKVDSVEGNITSLNGRVATAEGKVDSLNSRVTTAESKVNTVESDVSGLKSRVTTAEGNISSVESAIGNPYDAASASGSLYARVKNVKSTAESAVSSINAEVTRAQAAEQSAETAAANANTRANEAGIAAAIAQAALESMGDFDEDMNYDAYFWHDSEGAHVLGQNNGYRTDLDGDSMNIVSPSGTKIAEFKTNGIRFGSQYDYLTMLNGAIDSQMLSREFAYSLGDGLHIGTPSGQIDLKGISIKAEDDGGLGVYANGGVLNVGEVRYPLAPSSDSHVTFGYGLTPTGRNSLVTGYYNYADPNKDYAHVIGKGNDETEKNIYGIDWDGNIYTKGDVYVGCNAHSSGGTKLAKITEIPDISGKADKSTTYTKTEVDTKLGNKVDKVEGKGLSTNDYTTAEKNKLAGIAAGAEVNVQSDWNATSGDALILNKPTRFEPTYDSFSVVTYESSSKSISGSSAGSITQNITKAGYYPLGVVGTYCSGTNVPIRGAYLTNVANGSATINYYLRNVSSSAQSVTVTTRVLWVKI